MDENQNIPNEQIPGNQEQVVISSSSHRDWTSYLKEFLMLFIAVLEKYLVMANEQIIAPTSEYNFQ